MNPSFMGRCDICGKPIDLEHAGDVLTVYSLDDIHVDDEEVNEQMIEEAIIESLEVSELAEDALLLEALNEHREAKMHQRCFRKTTQYYDP